MSATMQQRISRHITTQQNVMRTPSILCIDDDPDLQTSFELRMREFEVEIEHAYYGMQGVVEAVNTKPDLILMDMAMPNGDGRYLLDCIKRNQATELIPVIVLTAMRDPELKHRLLAEGADVFLNKPVRFDDLVHEMGRFIELRSRQGSGGAL